LLHVSAEHRFAAARRGSTMIEVEGLTKRYRDHVAVENLSFKVGAGEIVGFLGPNGAGKSTTMRILTGSMPATAGRVRIGGIDVFDDPMAVKRRVGYLPEIPPVYLDMSVGGFLAFVARLKGVKGGEVKPEVRRVAELGGVDHILPRLIRNISKGYRQRVGIAQALVGKPEVLILDEPTVGLDPIQIEQVRRLITDLGKTGKHTIILSTHILGEVRATCERIVMIARGQIVADAKLSELEAQHGGSLEQAFTKLAVA
jgi:ABC-2 type transport system ATP-binding protein